jgi:hypothetical protein
MENIGVINTKIVQTKEFLQSYKITNRYVKTLPYKLEFLRMVVITHMESISYLVSIHKAAFLNLAGSTKSA